MKLFNVFIVIILGLLVINCGESEKEKATFFSIDETSFKPKYTLNDTLNLQVLNHKNKTIDSVIYFLNDIKSAVSKNNSIAKIYLNDKKLGYQNITATVYFNGEEANASSRIELLSNVSPKLLSFEIIATYDHDVNAFTEGYEFYNDTLIESTGQNGKSYIAKVDYKTGKIFSKVDLEQQYFGEGITVIDDKIYQLTWQSATGFIYDAKTLKRIQSFVYDKKIEGWGMTNDGTFIYHSDGTEKIWKMDPKTQKLIDYINVYTNESKIKSVNELEWIDGKIYGNVWQKDVIGVINPKTGDVEAVLDLSSLRTKVTNPEAEVLNGIAYNKNKNTIFVTGKNWNKTFEIRIK